MRLAALLSLLLVACSSNTGFEDERLLGCDSGQDIEIRAGLQAPRARMDLAEERLTMLVEIANLSRGEIFVKSIRIEQDSRDRSSYRIDPIWENVNRAIPENEDYTFELSMLGRGARPQTGQREYSTELVLVATVHLGNGDTYRCSFGVPAPV